MFAHHSLSSRRIRAAMFVALVTLPPVASRATADEQTEQSDASVDSMAGKFAGDVRDDNLLKMKLVWCPRGFVSMEHRASGANGEPETTEVRAFLSRGFWLGKYEVTQAEWKRVIDTEPWARDTFVRPGDDFPAADVTWHQALEFCSRLTVQERAASRLPHGWEYTLPTDAQWERACRAQTTTRFNFGDDPTQIGDYAWWGGNPIYGNGNAEDEKYAHRVGQKKPNAWGLHDMHGNVSEWCRDTLVGNPPGGRDPEVTKASDLRICRGGSWQSGADDCRSGIRCGNKPDTGSNARGFRVALSARHAEQNPRANVKEED